MSNLDNFEQICFYPVGRHNRFSGERDKINEFERQDIKKMSVVQDTGKSDCKFFVDDMSGWVEEGEKLIIMM